MPLTVTYPNGRLTASAAERTLSGQLVPFGQVGYTNLGALTVDAGVLTLPADPAALVLNREHDALTPIGLGTSVVETASGIDATFRVIATSAGDDALVEAAEGVRTGLSFEVDQPVISGGRLMSGVLVGAAQVVHPAFDSARLAASLHPDTPPTDPVAPATATEGENMSEPTAAVEPAPVLTASVPDAGLTATTGAGRRLEFGTDELYRVLAAYNGGHRTPTLLAALADVIPANILGLEQPQYVGELWSGTAYQRRYVPLFNHADLTSFKVSGWRWVTRPAVAAWTGGKTAVPSAAIATMAVEIDAKRIAGAHDIDRKFRDFNDTAFFAAYFAAMTESYKRVSDVAVLTEALAASTVVAPGAVPANVSKALSAIVDGVVAILDDTDTMPDWAVVSTTLWRDLLLTREQDRLAYLNAALGFENGELNTFKMLPSGALAATDVLVGTRSAATVHELGGDAPIRVESLDVSRGGVDEGVFGYYAVNVHDAAGLAKVTTL